MGMDTENPFDRLDAGVESPRGGFLAYRTKEPGDDSQTLVAVTIDEFLSGDAFEHRDFCFVRKRV